MHDPTGQISLKDIGSTPRSDGRALRIGIVGCGRVAETCHLPALRTLRGRARVVAVADVDEYRRRRVGETFDIAQTFRDVDAMLCNASKSIDVVAICTPAPFHADAAIAALRAGKHVLIEKPLALTLDDADRIKDAARTAAPHAKAAVGFNLRYHRLVEQARRMISNGLIGEIELIRTVWSCGIRQSLSVPPWRNRRTSGGGVLIEIAIHHVDLIRYLTGAEIEGVFAESLHGEGDDEWGALSLKLRNGTIASCSFTERSADANELEVFGTKGRLAFSLYRFDSSILTAPGKHGGRVGHLIKTIRDLPKVWPILRRGGDFRETYRRQWLAFLNAIERNEPVVATINDGQQALRVVLAAGVSANSGKSVAIIDAPRAPQPVGVKASIMSSNTNDAVGRPELTAIISTRGSFDAIRRTVRHLRAQTARGQMELLIVCPSELHFVPDADELEGFWGYRIVGVGLITSAARNNAAGVRAASAPIVVFCEDHAFPDPTWAEALILAHRRPYAAVGPVVRNANPSTVISWADCLIGYGPWLEISQPCEPEHLPGHNSSYKRDVLLSYSARLDEMLEAETVLQWDLRAQGHRLYLEPAARVAHTNFAQFGIWTKVQFYAGRMFASTRALGWPPWKRVAFMCGSTLIPLVRFRRTLTHARRVRGVENLSWRVLAPLLWGLALDGLGQMVGYAMGAGASRFELSQYEFERLRYVTEQDRRELAGGETVEGMAYNKCPTMWSIGTN